jgi:hypothetical protein
MHGIIDNIYASKVRVTHNKMGTKLTEYESPGNCSIGEGSREQGMSESSHREREKEE